MMKIKRKNEMEKNEGKKKCRKLLNACRVISQCLPKMFSLCLFFSYICFDVLENVR